MENILIVEDDPILGRGINLTLELEGYKVVWAKTLAQARESLTKNEVQLILLDFNLPDGHGLEFLKEFRKTNSSMAVVILTAQTDEESVVAGLNAGANDYLRKPFGNKELVARIKNVLRNPQNQGKVFRFGEMQVDMEKRKISYGEVPIEVNRREFDILAFFLQNAEKVVSREKLLESIDRDGEIFDRTVDSHVSHIRERLRSTGIKDIQISSVYGVGYRLERK